MHKLSSKLPDHPLSDHRLSAALCAVMFLTFGLATPPALAQASQQGMAPASPMSGKPVASAKSGDRNAVLVAQNSESGPSWKDLTPAQQQSLRPLAANWSRIDEGQKRKWLAMSTNYASLPPAEQQKLHSRMAEWASLSPQQRNAARLNFAESKTLSPDEKAANWQAYQALSAEEKKKLAAKAGSTPTGAAAAVKPVAPEKLANVPSTRRSEKPRNVAGNGSAVDSNTLLPKSAGAPDSPVQKN